MQAVTVDLDSTLCSTHHRNALLAEDIAQTDWQSYSQACVDDPAIEGTKRLVWMLQKTYRIVIVSGRSEVARTATEVWLDSNGIEYEDLLLDNHSVIECHSEYKVRRIREVCQDYDVVLHIDDWPGVKQAVEAELQIPVLVVNPCYTHNTEWGYEYALLQRAGMAIEGPIPLERVKTVCALWPDKFWPVSRQPAGPWRPALIPLEPV
jgi:hypothetical protein